MSLQASQLRQGVHRGGILGLDSKRVNKSNSGGQRESPMSRERGPVPLPLMSEAFCCMEANRQRIFWTQPLLLTFPWRTTKFWVNEVLA